MLLLWLDASPLLRAALAPALLLLCALLAALPLPPRHRRPARLALLLLAALTLLAGRYSTILLPFPIHPSPDESQMVAQAITSQTRPVPWRDFDPGSSGPLNVWVHLLSHLAGFEPSLATARLLSAGMSLLALALLWATLRPVIGDLPARLATLPPLALLALSTEPEILACTTEQLPVLALALAAFLAGDLARPSSRRLALRALATGLVLGAIPFTKLQATLPALALTALAYAVLLLRPRRALAPAAALTCGGLLFPGALLALLAATGALPDFLQSCIGGQSAYAAGGAPFGVALYFFPLFLSNIPEIQLLFWTALLLPAVLPLLTRRLPPPVTSQLRLLRSAYLLLLVSTAAVIWPGRPFPHYLLFLVLPSTAVIGIAANLLLRKIPFPSLNIGYWMLDVRHTAPPGQKSANALPSLLLALLLSLSPLAHFIQRGGPLHSSRLAELTSQPPDTFTTILRQNLPPGSTLAVWGWEPFFFILANAPCAVRDMITYGQATPGPLQEYYRQRWLHDFQSSRPNVFVDAVRPDGIMLTDPATQGHECFPAFANHIATHYHLIETIQGIRIYRRND